MLNRYYISGLLMAAFLAWQVHSVVPHHHHGTEICYNRHHCHEQECTDVPTPDGTCHSHDHGGDHDGCFLKQVTFLPVYHSKMVARAVQVKQGKYDLTVMFPDLENPGPGADPGPLMEGQNRNHFSGSPPLFTFQFLTPCGLRAPPSV